LVGSGLPATDDLLQHVEAPTGMNDRFLIVCILVGGGTFIGDKSRFFWETKNSFGFKLTSWLRGLKIRPRGSN
jgi:hypothetical protein